MPQDPAVERVVPGTRRRPGGDPALAAFPARAPGTRRWCFADQLGPHFLDRPDQPVLLIESKAVFARRRFHRQKAHLVLSALRHRAAELGDQAEFSQVHTYAEALDRVPDPGPVRLVPVARAALAVVPWSPAIRLGPLLGFRGPVPWGRGRLREPPQPGDDCT